MAARNKSNRRQRRTRAPTECFPLPARVRCILPLGGCAAQPRSSMTTRQINRHCVCSLKSRRTTDFSCGLAALREPSSKSFPPTPYAGSSNVPQHVLSCCPPRFRPADCRSNPILHFLDEPEPECSALRSANRCPYRSFNPALFSCSQASGKSSSTPNRTVGGRRPLPLGQSVDARRKDTRTSPLVYCLSP
jgi:hypothetical protein